MVSRLRAPTATGVVPQATWWSPREVQVTNERWCREPPAYSARKPALLQTALPSGWKTRPQTLTRDFVYKHASDKNFIVATYINHKRLDFAFTMVRHLVALQQPHYIVGAMDLPALEGLLSKGVNSFYINSGLTTEDYGDAHQRSNTFSLASPASPASPTSPASIGSTFRLGHAQLPEDGLAQGAARPGPGEARSRRPDRRRRRLHAS
eukprot:4843178-Prymnesium_polylepis.2